MRLLCGRIKEINNMTKTEFNELTSQEQWKWVLDNKEKISLIELDNDVTYVSSVCFKEDDDEETGSVSMKTWLGRDEGITDLMLALGIECQDV